MKKWAVRKWADTEIEANTMEEAIELGAEQLNEARSPDDFEYDAEFIEDVCEETKNKKGVNPDFLTDWWFGSCKEKK